MTAGALAFYAPGIVGYSIAKIAAPSFYSLQDARTPMVVSIITIAVNLVLNLWLNAVMGFRGLALGSAIAANVNAGLLLWLLGKRLGGVEAGRLAVSFAKILAASLVMAGAAYGADAALAGWLPAELMGGTLTPRAIRVLGGIGAGVGTLALAAWALVWQLVLQPTGLVNGILVSLGLDRVEWLRNPTVALLSLILVNAFKVLGFSMVLFLAALQTVPEDLREAGRVDGASERHVFRHITLPLIAPFTFMVTILLTISSFKSFAVNFLLTGGGPGLATTTWTLYIYRQGLQLFEMGYASSLAVVLFLFVLSVTVLQFAARRRWVHEGE